MDFLAILIFLVVFFVVVYLAVWVIEKFFPADLQVPVKVLLGAFALLYLVMRVAHSVTLPGTRR